MSNLKSIEMNVVNSDLKLNVNIMFEIPKSNILNVVEEVKFLKKSSKDFLNHSSKQLKSYTNQLVGNALKEYLNETSNFEILNVFVSKSKSNKIQHEMEF